MCSPHLEGLHKCPQQDADGVTLAQQLDEPSRPEELQETHVEAAGVHQLRGKRGEGQGGGSSTPAPTPGARGTQSAQSPWCPSG